MVLALFLLTGVAANLGSPQIISKGGDLVGSTMVLPANDDEFSLFYFILAS